MKLLEMILGNLEIRRNIRYNCELYRSIDDAIEKTLAENTNGTTVTIEERGKILEFDCCLHYSDAKEILLECRSFTEDGGQMIGAYLEVLDENLNIKDLEDYDDCIWEYTDWKKL